MIQIGNDKIKEIYVGSDKIKEVYYGSELVYTAHDPRGYWVHKDTGVVTYFGLDDPAIIVGIMYSSSWMSNASEVQLPSGVTGLAEYCFAGCSFLTSITLSESVTSIGGFCFVGCSSLTIMTVLPAIPPSLGAEVFFNNHSSLSIKVPSSSVNAYKAATNWTAYASKISAI